MPGLDDLLKSQLAVDSYSPWRRRYIQSPSIPFFLLSTVYHMLRHIGPSSTRTQISDPTRIRLVCISDTHNHLLPESSIPLGDILIHAGDLTQSGTVRELCATLDWLRSLPHPHKVLIAGNHDRALADRGALAELDFRGLTYLCDDSVELSIRGRNLKVYGSPWTPKHGNFAFQYPRDQGAALWASLPTGIDVLVTHGPPRGHLDHTGYGCDALLDALWCVKPAVMICGHIHAGRGMERLEWDEPQRAWEVVAKGKNNWAGWASVRSLVFEKGQASWILNCAVVGGARDQLVRDAITVDI
ncbi:Metallo-dependent phosphatase-like protein [Infundibulicybe gibba]|nr:Metallo-dependent phosphatase-like protein [Infundibulicybe gibba]